MTDLEMTKLCAEARGLPLFYPFGDSAPYVRWTGNSAERDTSDERGMLKFYRPLENDAQAMALVKMFPFITTTAMRDEAKTKMTKMDLNRAIVECVAKMQAGK